MDSQCNMILGHMRRNNGITSMEAFSLYGITRLAARISDLRDRGYLISSIRKDVVNRYGDKTQVCEYRLVEGEKPNA